MKFTCLGLQINVNGPLLLFQATHDLLEKSSDPKFVAISSVVGSIAAGGTNFEGGFYAYGASKAALNWVVRKLHHDFENFGELYDLGPLELLTYQRPKR